MRPAGSATTLSSLAETIKSIGIRRKAAVSPGRNTDSNTGNNDGNSICAAVTALQDCLVYARRAVLAVTGAALRVRIFFAYTHSTLVACVCFELWCIQVGASIQSTEICIPAQRQPHHGLLFMSQTVNVKERCRCFPFIFYPTRNVAS